MCDSHPPKKPWLPASLMLLSSVVCVAGVESVDLRQFVRDHNEGLERATPGVPPPTRQASIAKPAPKHHAPPPKKPLLLLHVGKSGGGSVRQRLAEFNHASGGRLGHAICHPNPYACDQERRDAVATVVTVREPVDRFVSAFVWRFEMLKRPDHNKTEKHHREAAVVVGKYRGDANAFAEALCDDQLRERDGPRKELALVGHANYGLADWVPDARAPGLFALPQAPGFDFAALTDAALRAAAAAVNVTVAPAPAPAPADRAAAVRHTSGANATTALSPRGRACVARHYWRDYAVIEGLAARACRGDLADACRRALASMLRDRPQM